MFERSAREGKDDAFCGREVRAMREAGRAVLLVPIGADAFRYGLNDQLGKPSHGSKTGRPPIRAV